MSDDKDSNNTPKPDQQIPKFPEIEALAEKYQIDVDAFRDITVEDIYLYLQNFPFLQMVNSQLRLNDINPEVQFIRSDSGWLIHDYGDALSSSPGELLFGAMPSKQKQDEDDEGGTGGSEFEAGKGVGTLVNQAFITAYQMVEIAKSQHWAGVQIVDGLPIMKRAAWIKAQSVGLSVTGFEPTKEDLRVYSRVQMSSGDMEMLRSNLRLSN